MKANGANRVENSHEGRLIPEGETKCIWMTAMVISYKLCNHQYDCENCPLDAAIRKDVLPAERQQVLSWPSTQQMAVSEVSTSVEKGETSLPNRKELAIESYLYFSQKHTWAYIKDPESIRIGIDSFVGGILPRVKAVVCSLISSRIVQGQSCCWIVGEAGTLPVVSPISGVVLTLNSRLLVTPDLCRQDPYGDGWLLTVKPENLDDSLRNLLYGEKVLDWLRSEKERLEKETASFLEKDRRTVGQTLADGGDMLFQLQGMVGPKRYFEIIGRFL